MSTVTFGQHVPDILDCLAQLSSGEVPTPPKLARAMLDLLPGHVWSQPDYVWLDPFSKSGVFLREVATRLLDGLAGWESDYIKRREHIFRSMIYGTSITEMTGILSRRSVYCSSDASSSHSVVRFDDPQGNLPFVPAEHDFGTDGKCAICRIGKDIERGDTRENYAYSFTHGSYPMKEMVSMKFDVIVGNPPFPRLLPCCTGRRWHTSPHTDRPPLETFEPPGREVAREVVGDIGTTFRVLDAHRSGMLGGLQTAFFSRTDKS